MFPGVQAGVFSEADGSSPASVVREDRVLANAQSGFAVV